MNEITNSFNRSLCLDPPKVELETSSAILIQKTFRAFRARLVFLPRSLYSAYSLECGRVSDTTPRAQGGKTVVYLPKDLPEVVLKNTGQERAKYRFRKMRAMREVAQSQGLTSFAIPKARLCGDFLVEERLDIHIDSEYNAELYIRNQELFNEPVRQMVRFFKRAYIHYLTEQDESCTKVIEIRYDNMPFILKEKEGKQSIEIGFVDLERVEAKPLDDDAQENLRRLYKLVTIFPYHRKIIEEEAQKLGFVLTEEGPIALDQAEFYSKEYLSTRYIDVFTPKEEPIFTSGASHKKSLVGRKPKKNSRRSQ